jgi:trehalose-phosphatase
MEKLNAEIIQQIASSQHLFLFLDYDGTLTPIVERPEEAILQVPMRETLEQLGNLQGVRVAIVSGRSLVDIKKMVGIKHGIVYVGNHGLEIEGEDIRWSQSDAPRFRELTQRILEKLKAKLGNVPGILLEDKGLGVSLHYRLVSPERYKAILPDFLEIVSAWTADKTFCLKPGKKVWEIIPKSSWNKGCASMWLLEHFASEGAHLPVAIGDDVTDEDVFITFNNRGITIKVVETSEESSEAAYWLHSPDDVADFLKEIIKIRVKKVLGNV